MYFQLNKRWDELSLAYLLYYNAYFHPCFSILSFLSLILHLWPLPLIITLQCHYSPSIIYPLYILSFFSLAYICILPNNNHSLHVGSLFFYSVSFPSILIDFFCIKMTCFIINRLSSIWTELGMHQLWLLQSMTMNHYFQSLWVPLLLPSNWEVKLAVL